MALILLSLDVAHIRLVLMILIIMSKTPAELNFLEVKQTAWKRPKLADTLYGTAQGWNIDDVIAIFKLCFQFQVFTL